MNNYVSEILGKTISSVILRERIKGNPRCQLLIGFEDGSNFEFYCSDDMIHNSNGLSPQDAFDKPCHDGIDVIRIGYPANYKQKESV